MAASFRSEQHQNLFRAALGQSAREGDVLLREVFHAALRALDAEIAKSAVPTERDQLRGSRQWLDRHAAALCAQFPALLRQEFQSKQVTSSQFGELALGELNHHQLEQMDEIQVQERLEMARVLRLVQRTVQSSLSELDRCMSALEGLDRVRPARNPLRPQIYLKVLHGLMVDAAVPTTMRIIWFNRMAMALGKALQGSYTTLVQKIRSYGVTPLPLNPTVVPDRQLSQPTPAPARRPTETGETSSTPNVLTLDRLHDLLAGQPSVQEPQDPAEAKTQFAGAIERNVLAGSDEPTTDFAATIPAAFEALQNMNQADDVLPRLPQRQRAASDAASRPDSIREKFRRHCQGSAQLLSFEVMCRMLDSLVQDTRLLEPIRRVIEELEPALFRLVKVDVRFFNNKQHPARRLLQELTQRGLAFDSVDAPGYALFIRSLHRYVNPLSRMPVDSAEPFELALRNLNAMWSHQSVASSKTEEQARQALGRAEERNLLAGKMVAALERIPDMQRVPAAVAGFLCGPWAQVMAFAELNNSEGVEDPGGYRELVNLLLWSAQPELTRQDVPQLTGQVARLLTKLREGLALIDYPSQKTSAFFDALMKLHQQAFQPPSGASHQPTQHRSRENLLGFHQPWVAPTEAQDSGFMDIPDEEVTTTSARSADPPSTPMLDSVIPRDNQDNAAPASLDPAGLTVGTWVEIRMHETWLRSQLSWISPQNTMYLFTNAQGGTQSMTRRSLENLLATDALRVVSQQSMVDGALDAVVQTAMLNSLDLRL